MIRTTTTVQDTDARWHSLPEAIERLWILRLTTKWAN